MVPRLNLPLEDLRNNAWGNLECCRTRLSYSWNVVEYAHRTHLEWKVQDVFSSSLEFIIVCLANGDIATTEVLIVRHEGSIGICFTNKFVLASTGADCTVSHLDIWLGTSFKNRHHLPKEL